MTPHHPPTFDVKRTAEALKAEIRAFGDRPAIENATAEEAL